MNTSLTEDRTSTPNTIAPAPPTPLDRRRRRTWIASGIAAAAVFAIAGAVVVANIGGDAGTGDLTAPPLELSLGDSTVMSSCIPFDTTFLAGMSPAFAATAVEVADGSVTLDVDKWYAGGDADLVVLDAQPGMQALIDGFEFEVGQQYLITAADGTVNFCGYSGPATAELTAAFDTAFGG